MVYRIVWHYFSGYQRSKKLFTTEWSAKQAADDLNSRMEYCDYHIETLDALAALEKLGEP